MTASLDIRTGGNKMGKMTDSSTPQAKQERRWQIEEEQKVCTQTYSEFQNTCSEYHAILMWGHSWVNTKSCILQWELRICGRKSATFNS